MARSRNRRSRRTGSRKYKRIFNLVCEGVKTEPEYFNWFREKLDNDAVKLNIISKKTGESSPSDLIAAAKKTDTDYKENDQLWIIMDRDQWTKKQFQEIANWNQKHKRNKVAVSNPKFEYWVLLHDVKDPGSLTARECSEKYRLFMSSNKGIDTSKLSVEAVLLASRRAKQKHDSTYNSRKTHHLNFKPETCGSTLYRLIDELKEYLYTE